MKFFTTNEQRQWLEIENHPGEINTTLVAGDPAEEIWEGFGGCFNELSQIALLQLPEEKRKEAYDMLFSKEADGLRFDFCRIPIGASDYAESWYSLNETDSDYEMAHFSIERDKKYLLPYIKEALKRNPEMKFFASPWSPPTWMKHPKAYNYGTLVWTPENLKAYALYLALFIESYEREGVHIHQLHVQNEPVSSQKFPSCIWTREQFAEFIGKYLGPLFEERGIQTKIWLGTLNAPETDDRALHTRFNHYANLVLHDPDANRYIEGVSYQWAGKYAVQITHAAFPEKKLLQSENECGNGENSWQYANYLFEMFHHYITNGVCAYTYWNMVLAPGGESTWGWKQNSLLTASDKLSYHYEFYLMKHFARYVVPSARRIKLTGHFCGNAVLFQNPNGTQVLICQNPFKKETCFSFAGTVISLPPQSINTIVLD